MKVINTLLFTLLIANFSLTQEAQSQFKTLVVGQFDKPDERYAIEVAITDLFTRNGIAAIPSLNVIKQGE